MVLSLIHRFSPWIVLVWLLLAVKVEAMTEVFGGSNTAYSQEELQRRIAELQNQNEYRAGQEIVVSLFFDRRHLADLIGKVQADGHLEAFRYRDLKRFLRQLISEEAMLQLGERQDIHGWVGIVALGEYSPTYDQDSLSLHFTSPADERDSGVIDLQPKFPIDLSRAVYPRDTSGYVNLFNQMTHDAEGVCYRLVTEGAFRWDPWVIEGRADMALAADVPFDFDNLRLIRDFPQQVTRLTIGETQSFTPRVLSSDRIYGVKYSTEYQVKPRLITEPISEFSFLLQRDSTVEVWVNGQLFDTLRLQAGPYDVLNLPLRLGLNQVVLKIFDDLGREQTLFFDALKGPNLLAPGRREFSGSIGVKGGGRTVSDDWVGSGFYRRGLAEWCTWMAEGRGDSDHFAFGTGIDFTSPWFFGVLEGGCSVTEEGIGQAAQSIFSRHFDTWAVSSRFDYHSEKYFSQGQSLTTDRIKWLQEVSITVLNFFGMGTLNARAGNFDRWVGKSELMQELRWTYSFNDRWSFIAKGTHSDDPDKKWDAGGQVSYSYNGENYRHRHDAQLEHGRANLRSVLGGNPSKKWGDWLVTHNMGLTAGRNQSLSGVFRYRHNRFTALYRGEVGDFGDASDIKQTVNLHTAIAFANGAVAMGQPIVNSFAIVRPDLGLGDVEVDALSAGIHSAGNAWMGPLISNLRAYDPRYLTAEATRDDTILEPYPFLLMPKYKSGFVLDLDNEEGDGGVLTVSGTLISWGGELMIFKALFINNKDEPDEEPFVAFTNEKGIFYVYGVHPGREYEVRVGRNGRIVVDRKHPSYTLLIPEDSEPGGEVLLGRLEPLGDRPPPAPWELLPPPRQQMPPAGVVPPAFAAAESKQVPIPYRSAELERRTNAYAAAVALPTVRMYLPFGSPEVRKRVLAKSYVFPPLRVSVVDWMAAPVREGVYADALVPLAKAVTTARGRSHRMEPQSGQPPMKMSFKKWRPTAVRTSLTAPAHVPYRVITVL
jgi:outer membrane usher protein